MLKTQVAHGPGGRVLLVGSITQIGPEDEGAWVVSASHGGVSSAEFALEVPLRGAFFNDAGVGKDAAGIAALDMLQRHGVAAASSIHRMPRSPPAVRLFTVLMPAFLARCFSMAGKSLPGGSPVFVRAFFSGLK